MSPDPENDASLALSRRQRLPAELLPLLADYPRGTWEKHPDFNRLVAFWLDRHLGFRQMMALLRADALALTGGRMDPLTYRPRLVQTGSRLLNELIGHHQIEDQSYFPMLTELEPRLLRGFEILDSDHHELHDRIDSFATGANAALAATDDTALRAAIARFGDDLSLFDAMLSRHLSDEEDLVLPVVLKHRVG